MGQNLASQPKNINKALEKKAKTDLRKSFPKSCAKIFEKHTFCKKYRFFSLKLHKNLANFQQEMQNQFAAA